MASSALLHYLLPAMLLTAGTVRAQNSFPLADLVPFPRGGALGGQVFSGDLLAAGIDPTVAAGEGPALQLAGGSHLLDLSWASAGGRFRVGGSTMVFVLSTLSYGSQFRTGMDDRLGLFGGAFTPSDLNLSGSMILLQGGGTTIGAGLTLLYGQLDDLRAFGLSAAVAVRQKIGLMQLRGGISNLGTVISAYGVRSGTRIPPRLRAGLGVPFSENRWEASSEILFRSGDRNVGWSSGVEWLPMENAALRIGFTQGDAGGVVSDNTLSDAGLTAGIALWFSEWRVSWVYRSGGLLGSSHLLALGWRLGPLR
ncbi:hypothetical protein ACFL6T_01915 [Candidatus Zixiibacteriota bacterium]